MQTKTKRLQRLRRNIVELYLSEQPAAGPVPEALQRLALSYGVRSVRYHNPARRLAYRDDSNPFFSFDNAACVSCARCVRACDEIQGTFALTMIGRGFSARPAAGAGSLMGEAAGFATSNCVSCGACVKECPTGALTEKTVLEQGAPTGTVRTTCAYCGVGCAFDAGVRDGRVVTMMPADDGPSNQGHACMKGRFGWTYNYAPDRLRVPLLRRGTGWEEIAWESALDLVAQEFTRIKDAAWSGCPRDHFIQPGHERGELSVCEVHALRHRHQPHRQLCPRLPQRDRHRHDGDTRCLGCDEFHSGSRSGSPDYGGGGESD